MTNIAVQRYAKALLAVTHQAGQCDAVYHDLSELERLIGTSDELKVFFESPTVPTKRRKLILQEIFQGKVGDLTYRFMLFLESKSRLELLTQFYEVFQKLYFEYKGMVNISATSAMGLTEHKVHELTESLRRKFGKEIRLKLRVDPALLGGMTIQKDEVVYDGSLRAQLERFRKQIITG